MRPVELDQTEQKKTGFSIRNLFRVDPTIGVSKFRVYVLRFFFILILLFLAPDVWGEIFAHKGFWEPLPGIAFSFWGAFSALAILGILYPLKMIPLLLIQLSYKLIWLIMVGYPLWSTNQLTGSAQSLATINLQAVVVDLLIIPWPYVLRNYVLGPKRMNNLAR